MNKTPKNKIKDDMTHEVYIEENNEFIFKN